MASYDVNVNIIAERGMQWETRMVIDGRRARAPLAATLTGLAIVVLSTGCGGSAAPAASPPPVADTPAPSPAPSASPTSAPAPVLVFAEEFDSATLDRTRWNVEGPGLHVNNEQQRYVDSADTIAFARPAGADGGALLLRPVWRPGFTAPNGSTADFVSGRIHTANKFAITYGKVSARIRMPAGSGLWPAFWMLGYGNWPDSGETDIMEYVGERGWTSAAMHGPGYSGDTPLVKRQDFPAGEDVTGWHVYSVERSASAVAFYVDDREFYRVTKADVERYGAWRFDRPQYVILNFALGGVYPNAVNKVDKPYFGLPQATVELIKTGQPAMEVDWVRAWASN